MSSVLSAARWLALPLMAIATLRTSQAQTTTSAADNVPVKSLGVVTVNGGQPTSLPTQIPATMEGITRDEIARTVNATDSEDALRYLPSLLVRKRYIGDYNHAILSSRASGTGNSARSAVYADGILLSNYLGNGVGGLSFPPRWGMVTPEEIDRVDVMYGPFSAAYPGNSVGAVVVFTTRMPTAFEAHAKVGYSTQHFELYGTDSTYRAWETSAAVGNKSGALAWLVNVDHTESHGQPLTFATRFLSSGTTSAAGTPVTGAVLAPSNTNAPWYVLGTGTEYRSEQDHLKIKLAYDITPTIRANYLLGVWQNHSENTPISYLRNASGQPVYSGAININGQSFAALTGADFAATKESLTHLMHGLTLKSHTEGLWDWELDASLYDYRKDDKRQNGLTNTLPDATTGGPGTIADGSGTGWNNLAAKGTWRPFGLNGEHIVDFGAQLDSYKLTYLTSNIAGNWLSDSAGSLASNVAGKTQLASLYAQDAWAFAPAWKTVLGLRAEDWRAHDGATVFSSSSSLAYPSRNERYLSPKAALSMQAAADLVLKASLGRAVRMPTVGELYGATSTTNSQYINDPNLKPEKSWTTELSAEKDLGNALLRLTWFSEDTHDSLYSQTTFDPVANKNISRVQNIARIHTDGLELALNSTDLASSFVGKGFDLNASVTYADSVIKANDGFVVVPGDTIGKRQPNIPKWRATALASYRFDERWSTALGARYSGTQYRTLNNADVNGFAYQGVSRYFTMDLRVRLKITKQWSAAVGIDNLNNYQYWNFHPYSQRSVNAELKYDL